VSNPKRIRDLCKAWLAAAQSPDGGLAIGGDSDQHRLHQNGVEFHKLSLEELRAACLGLIENLLLAGMSTVIDLDHQLLWSWGGQLLLAPRARVFSDEELEIAELFEICVLASLAGARPPLSSREEWRAQKRLFHIEELNAREFVQHAHAVLPFLALPLLEAITKKACRAYVDYSGHVLQDWSAPGRGSAVRNYSPSDPNKSRCSSVRDLLYLLYDTVAGPDLRAALDEIRAIFRSRDPSKDPFDTIFDWRNQVLHGQTSHQTIGGTVLSIVILVSLEFVAGDYDARRDRQVGQLQWEQQTGSSSGARPEWSYYPPF